MTKKIKFLLYIPLFLVEYLLGKVSGYVSCLNMNHLIMSAKIDNDKHISKYKLHKFKEERSTSYIANKNLRRTIDFLNLFSIRDWQVFSIYDKTDEGREVIYLTKEKIKLDDLICGERISDFKLSKKYSSRNIKRTLRKNNVKDISELEPQIYVVVSRVNKEHDIMDEQRMIRYAKNKINEFNKRVNKAIKNDNVTGRWSMGDFTPVFHKCVLEDRIDLVNKMINSSIDDMDRLYIVNYEADDDTADMCLGVKKGDIPIDLVKSDEMRNLLNKYTIKKPTK